MVFQSKIYIQQIKENGLQVGTTKIAPKRTKPTRGYLPNLPVYALEEEVRELLTNHGNVVGLYPRTRNDGIRIGGWNFYIHLESHNSMPEFLLYDNEKYEIIHATKVRKKIKITTEEAKTPPPAPPNTTEMELLPFPESSMTIDFENNTPPILETNTPPIRTPKTRETRAPTDIDESRRRKKRTVRKDLRIGTETILERTVK